MCYSATASTALLQRLRLMPSMLRYTTLYYGGICVPPTVTYTVLAVPRFRLNTYGRRAFSVAGPMAWNSLPDFVRDPTSVDLVTIFLVIV